MNPAILLERLDEAVARGVLTAGQAHRVALAAELDRTLALAGGSSLGAALSGEMLGRALGLSRAAVHKHVEHLRSLGFAIDSVAGAGYRLTRPHDDLVVPEAVLPFLLELVGPQERWVAGLPYRYLERCGSTNAALKSSAASSPAGTLVVSDGQIEGRGRLGRTWVSEPGKDLTFSVLLRPELAPAQAHLLSLAAAVAVAEVLEGIPGLPVRVGIKWPNDVLLDDKKVCGILLEGSMDADRLQWAIAGIGLNVNSDPSALMRGMTPGEEQQWAGRPRPASLRGYLGDGVPRAPLLASLLASLTHLWTRFDPASVLEDVRRRDVLRGRPVEVLAGPPRNELVIAGEALGVGPEGQLLVRGPEGETVPVFAGDVTVRGAWGQPPRVVREL
ncbi:MAG: biotin--[acetyl-CoA-carboxylase] ligase [Actinobacteria bacterium RBG_16_64_13]|nr:MAG: biotin--[acetyl-CoA-carboxylase] ligase [Actinobacteria bacterium RBG_16_64_13]